MTKRIDAISKLIEKSDTVLDIGCDMALLGEVLAKRGICSYASDIKEGIVSRAEVRIKELGLLDFVTFFVSDGLKNIEVDADTLVLAGMGTFTILEILGFSLKKYKKIITISNNNHEILREKMLELGYIIDTEEIIKERDKFYNLICFIPGNTKYTKRELAFGRNHKNLELLHEKNEFLLKKYKQIYNKSKNDKIKELIDLLSN